MKCDIVRDLLPLYADDLASDASREMIEAHAKECSACRELMEKMCTPMERSACDEERVLVDGLKRQKQKLRKRMILACVITALVCLLSWWIYMETHFTMTRNVVVETNAQRLLGERPELALTQEEKALADSILEFPVIREKMEAEETVAIPLRQVPEEWKGILPENAELTEVAVILGTSVSIDYRWGDLRVIIEYLDPNQDGTVDLIRKTVAVRNSPDTWEADTVYVMEYVIALDKAYYEKIESHHVWFGFLQMP